MVLLIEGFHKAATAKLFICASAELFFSPLRLCFSFEMGRPEGPCKDHYLAMPSKASPNEKKERENKNQIIGEKEINLKYDNCFEKVQID